ncbi:manganese-dependent ADP-ribose/CDP-alcohol diphosphatase-like [Dreissena polymorpha]|uniref:Calcineurin-like phosphoesterase domain-containing protein n=1 Tax=Dreissena polymorpha TaxID=45954 RepID=A0A9D4RL54_DREPO|nr:manganese-dependent ADP-ribose/CDP-alcohol diphosphatase-like [Dreissena polymorpha]XP_052266740.1 manganese-dependent ADP-ribose/CDP-alcohol diphosphatase-like [Dreissena polymorpha]XP_052266741.1 manganese-dependent ADP-ribose/CDP-alcohol diphosphatase-like [Dreissena polymorpha]XP_052266742.1 manganese-dependent ADP-ribose/CDP-alcohol diphosphatase-like [Dreissena polymorpha]KAH3872369.1 hypothetical protein DPMN_035585 [Dreissena polymorpha]
MESKLILSFGAIADIQYADIEDGYNFAGTRERYYRTALRMLKRAISSWNNNDKRKPSFVLQLGDIIDGKNKPISERALNSVLGEFAQFDGPVYHIWGNHEYYNFSRKFLLDSPIYSGLDKNVVPVKNKAYYMCVPHPQLRILALDCYEISHLACLKDSEDYKLASRYLEINANEDVNCCKGLEGTNARFVQYNGALSTEQIDWIDKNLTEAEQMKQNVIVIGHCGVCPGSIDSSCLCWNAPEVLQVLQSHSSCMVAYLAGHDHFGGMACDDQGIMHITFPGVVENKSEADFGTFYMYEDRLELVGNGRAQTLTLRLRYMSGIS